MTPVWRGGTLQAAPPSLTPGAPLAEPLQGRAGRQFDALEVENLPRTENQIITATIAATPMIAATVRASQGASFNVLLGMGGAAA